MKRNNYTDALDELEQCSGHFEPWFVFVKYWIPNIF